MDSALIAAALHSSVPLLLAGLGLLINERAGVLNLGAEGMMLMGAVLGFIVALQTDSLAQGFLMAALAGALMAALFAILALGLAANQVASGLALSIFGTGLAAFLGQSYVGKALTVPNYALPYLSDLPWLGAAFFQLPPLAYFTFLCVPLVAWFFSRSRLGLELRALGEAPEAAHALGYPVLRLRWYATLVGGAFCGLGGAYVSLAYTPMWIEGVVSGRGWIALALTTFATWQAPRMMLGALLFGTVMLGQFYVQALGVAVPPQFLSMLPYAATIVVLILISRNPKWIRRNMPVSLGKPFVVR